MRVHLFIESLSSWSVECLSKCEFNDCSSLRRPALRISVLPRAASLLSYFVVCKHVANMLSTTSLSRTNDSWGLSRVRFPETTYLSLVEVRIAICNCTGQQCSVPRARRVMASSLSDRGLWTWKVWPCGFDRTNRVVSPRFHTEVSRVKLRCKSSLIAVNFRGNEVSSPGRSITF